MTTDQGPEPDSETTPDYSPTVTCHGCGGEVQRRRPSMTGAHFCTKPDCVRAKGRYYHRRRTTNAAAEEAERAKRLAEVHRLELVNFIAAVANADRADCESCGRAGVIPRYSHPTPDWSAACAPPDRLGISPDPALTMAIMRAVYPS